MVWHPSSCEVTYKNIQSILGKTLKENGFVNFVLNVEFDEDQARARELPDCIRSSRTRPERHVKAHGCGLEECFLRGNMHSLGAIGDDLCIFGVFGASCVRVF